MFFTKTPNGMWMPCGPKQPGAVQTTMQDLAAKGLAAQVHENLLRNSLSLVISRLPLVFVIDMIVVIHHLIV